MAKKKRRRPTTSGRPATGGAAVATTTRRSESAAPTIKPAPAEPGGPNRQARKEEARRQREAIRRRMARRQFMRRGGIVALVVVIVSAVSLYFVLKPNAAEAAGCGKVQTIAPYNPSTLDRAHITDQGQVKAPPPLSSYRSVPPASGPHELTPWAAGVNNSPPGVYRTIHSLEHGAAIIWYNPTATGGALQQIKNFYSLTSNIDHVIVAPYNYPDQGAQGHLPTGKQMVLVAWHHMEVCTKLSLPAAKSFVASYRTLTGSIPPGYKGDAPEAGSQI
jgi:hypothetical protein